MKYNDLDTEKNELKLKLKSINEKETLNKELGDNLVFLKMNIKV